MPLVRRSLIAAALAAASALLPIAAHAQLTVSESGFLGQTLSGDYSKQVEIGVGLDTCIYVGTFDGLQRRCSAFDPGTICDPDLTFPAGIAFSTDGSFGSYMYISDFGLNEIRRSAGCATAAPFAALYSPGSVAFPPSGSAYGDYLYTCEAFNGPIYRVNSAGTITPWVTLGATYLRFGPGGAWGTGMYATDFGSGPGSGRIVQVSSSGTVTPLATGFGIAEGFDWGFDGDLFAADLGTDKIYRVKSDGTKTPFATLSGVADLAYRPAEDALYVVSNEGGLYRIRRGDATAVGDQPLAARRLTVAPNPSASGCQLRFSLRAPGLARAQVLDATGRIVRRLPEVWCPAGSHTTAWDGRDDAGRRVRPGAYYVRLVAGGETRSATLAIVR